MSQLADMIEKRLSENPKPHDQHLIKLLRVKLDRLESSNESESKSRNFWYQMYKSASDQNTELTKLLLEERSK